MSSNKHNKGPQPAATTDAEAQTDATQTDVQTQADAGEETQKPARKKKEAVKKKPPFYVAPGKAVTSRRGILSGDTEDEVKPEYLRGGESALKALIETGHVQKGG